MWTAGRLTATGPVPALLLLLLLPLPLLLLAAGLVAGVAAAADGVRQEILDFDPAQVTIDDAQDGARVRYRGAFTGLGALGAPDLPVWIMQLEIPAATTVRDVHIELLDTAPVARGLRVAPAHGDRRVGEPEPVVPADASIYESDAPFPRRLARFAGRGAMRGHTIATLHIRPWIYRPATGALDLVTRMRVRLELGAAEPIGIDRHRIDPRIEARFERTAGRNLTGGLQSLVDGAPGTPPAAAGANGSPGGPAGGGPYQPTFRPTGDGSAVEYVIVTSAELAPEFQRLADWKTQKGVQAVVRTIEWIDQTYPNGVDQAERVRFFIRDAYQNWGTLWVLLGGDTDVVPFRLAEITLLGGESIPADYYFMCLDGNWNLDGDDRFGEGWVTPEETGDAADFLPEVYVGRAPTSTPAEVQTFVDKTLLYETTPAGGNGYPASALFLAERLFPSFDGAEVAEEAVALLPPWWTTVRLYEEFQDWPGALPLDRQAAVDSISNGFGIVHHVGHGFHCTMSVGGEENTITCNDADNFSNGGRQSVFFAINCSSAAIDFNSIGESILRNPDGGGLAYYGTSRFAFVNSARDIQEGWYTMVFQDSLTAALGEVCTNVRLPFVAAAEFDNSLRWTLLALTLLGDPEVDLYINDVVPLEVTHAATHELGSGGFAVHVASAGSPVADASVTLWIADQLYSVGATDGLGDVTLDVPAEATGDATLTVHKGYYRPYQVTVTLTAPGGPYAFVQSVAVDDDATGASSGDGDGQADVGETVELAVTVKNGGGAGLTGATGVITVDDPGGHMTLTNDTVGYGTIGAGGQSAGTGSFVVDIAAAAPEALLPVFTLTLTANEGVWTDVFVLPIRRPYLEHFAHTVDDAAPRGDGDGQVEAGEEIWYTIDLRNAGQETAFGVGASLRVLRAGDGQPEPLVSIPDGQMGFGQIGVGATVTGDRFEMILDATVDPDSILLEVTYLDALAQTWAETLDVVKPGVADSLRAFGAPTWITLKWRRPADGDVLGYDVYRSMSPGGPFARVNEFLAEGAALYEDAGLPVLTRFYYQVVARDSSYNAGAASAVFSGSTGPPVAAGWPQTLGQTTASSMQVADLDGDWSNEVFTAADYQYAWHANGDELVDGDADARTNGPFAPDGFHPTKGFGATAAIGDVDLDGQLEVCNVAWTLTGIYLWDSQGQLMPGWPKDVLTDFNWASPVLADLDLDGDLEVVVWAAKGGRLFAWHHDGVEVADGDGDPQTDGVLYRVFGVSFNYSSPAVGDVDGDPEPEIVFCTNLSSAPTDPQGGIYVINPDGTDVPGWPVLTGDENNQSQITASPVIVDLDGNGSNEVIIPSERDGGTMHVLNGDGTDFPGWPQLVPSVAPQTRVAGASVGDVDGDTNLDIVYPDSDGQLWVWDRNANVLPGFPITYLPDAPAEASQSTAVIGDVDEDGEMEILFGDESSKLHAFNHDGSPAAGFPIQLQGEVRSSPAIWDIDADSLIEVGVAGWDARIYIWDMPFAWNPSRIPWPFFRHDPQNTGYFGQPVQTGVEGPGAGPPGAPRVAAVEPPFPNPFNPYTRFAFEVPGGASRRVRIAIYDVSGRLIRTLVDGRVEPGRHIADWDGRGRGGRPATTGVYFYRAWIGDFAAGGKLTLVK